MFVPNGLDILDRMRRPRQREREREVTGAPSNAPQNHTHTNIAILHVWEELISPQSSHAMSEQHLPTVTTIPWPLRQFGRLLLSALAGAAVALAATALPRQTRIIFGLDVFLVSFVALTSVLVSTTTGAQCAAMAEQRAPIRHTALIGCVLATLIGIAAIGVMLHSQEQQVVWLRMAHLAGSLVALLFGWIAAQLTFAVQYMRIYYRTSSTKSNVRADPGLDFPGQPTPDLWDFVYYSFTIAMCFQTSDVSIRGMAMRRLTLMHALYSFFFVATIIGFVVNVLSNLA